MVYRFIACVSLFAAFVSFLLAGATGESSATVSALLALCGFAAFVKSTLEN